MIRNIEIYTDMSRENESQLMKYINTKKMLEYVTRKHRESNEKNEGYRVQIIFSTGKYIMGIRIYEGMGREIYGGVKYMFDI